MSSQEAFRLETWIQDVQCCLADFDPVDIGYPKGDNRLTLADRDCFQATPIALPLEMEDFYRSVQEVCLPDVFSGYFVHSIGDIVKKSQTGSFPGRIKEGEFAGDVLTFGTSGGGDIFVIHRQLGDQVLLIPSHSMTGSVLEGAFTNPKFLADDFNRFLLRLLADMRAFTSRMPDWDYMI